jgi:hypothetical protein
MLRLLCLTPFLLLAACGIASDRTDGDTGGTKFERGVDEVGRRLESAAAGLQSKVEETRVQAVVDNIRGLEEVEVQMVGAGTIRLIGVVADELTRKEAERIATRIIGVDSVENALVVKGAQPAQ